MPEAEGQGKSLKPAVYTLRFALPGVEQDDIMVAFVGNCVEVYGRAHTEQMEERPDCYHFETEEIVTHHRVPLPPDADTTKARVTLAPGLAMVEIPRLL